MLDRLPETLFGMNVIVDEACVARDWIFPEDRFVEYEKSDERWAIPNKFGRWSEYRPCAYLMGNFWMMHPKIWSAIQLEATMNPFRMPPGVEELRRELFSPKVRVKY